MEYRNSEDQEAYSLIVRDKYFLDLKKIIDYIALIQKQPLNAIKVSIGINATMNKIVNNPMIYAECENMPTKSKMYREAVYKSWRIVFKIKELEVIILSVISGKRKPKALRNLKNLD